MWICCHFRTSQFAAPARRASASPRRRLNPRLCPFASRCFFRIPDDKHAEHSCPIARRAFLIGAMPVLPHAARSVASDTRILDARQAGRVAQRIAQSLATNTRQLLKRIPTIVSRQYDPSTVCGQGYIAACYKGLYAGPTPGAVVGIVLGSIAGFLFLLWLLWILSSGTSFIRTTELREEEDVVVRRRSRSPRSRRSGHRSSYREEMRHSTSRPERVIRQERIVREVPRAETSRVRETVIVDEHRPERRVDGDDIVEVIEEHSSVGGAPPPRRKSRRNSGYR